MGHPRSPARFGVAVTSTGGAYDWRYPQGLPAVNVSGAGVTNAASAPAGAASVIPVVAPVLSVPTFSGTTATIAFSGGSGYTTLIPQYSTDGATWTSAANDTVSPFTIPVPSPSTLYYFRALPNNVVGYATNIVSATSGSGLPLIYSTDFEALTVGANASGGVFSGAGAGVNIGGSATILVSSAQSHGGTKSLEFQFPAGGGLCEQDINLLTGNFTKVTLDYWLYIPPNYAHGSASPNNNKFFRIGSVYPVSGGFGRMGASLTRNADGSSSDLEVEWEDIYNLHGGGFTNFPAGTYGTGGVAKFIDVVNDVGKWMHVRIELICPTAADAAQNNPSVWGSFKVYKNGTLVANNTPNNYSNAGTNFWSYAYIFGATNAPFAAQTKLYIDDFSVYAQ